MEPKYISQLVVSPEPRHGFRLNIFSREPARWNYALGWNYANGQRLREIRCAWRGVFDFRQARLLSSLEVYQLWSVSDRLELASKVNVDARFKWARMDIRLDLKF